MRIIIGRLLIRTVFRERGWFWKTKENEDVPA